MLSKFLLMDFNGQCHCNTHWTAGLWLLCNCLTLWMHGLAAAQVPQGATPRMMTVHLQGSLTRSLKPGNAVTIAGIFLPLPYTGFKAMRAGLLTNTYLLVCQPWPPQACCSAHPACARCIAVRLDRHVLPNSSLGGIKLQGDCGGHACRHNR